MGKKIPAEAIMLYMQKVLPGPKAPLPVRKEPMVHRAQECENPAPCMACVHITKQPYCLSSAAAVDACAPTSLAAYIISSIFPFPRRCHAQCSLTASSHPPSLSCLPLGDLVVQH
eukprot:1157810-Pelagomonas_calceolata.AAC.4